MPSQLAFTLCVFKIFADPSGQIPDELRNSKNGVVSLEESCLPEKSQSIRKVLLKRTSTAMAQADPLS